MKPKYTIEIKQSLQNNWVVTLYDGAAIVRSATCPLRKQAEKQYRLWRKQFMGKKPKPKEGKANAPLD